MPRESMKLGDVVEISVGDERFAYAQYINHHRTPPRYGALIRVLPGVFHRQPDDLAMLVDQTERFCAFFPLAAACSQGFVRVVGNHPVPVRLRKWPLFKAYNENVETGNRTWWIWDGTKSTKIGKLPSEYYDLPMEETVDLKVLRDRILAGWAPRDEVRPNE